MDLTINADLGNSARGSFDSSLVNLYDCQNLVTLARDKTPAARAVLLDNMTGFFELQLKEQEKELASDVLLSLIRQAETDLRKALAERLAENENVPLRVVLTLANDDISVAESVLKHSPVLNEFDLMCIIMSHSADHWAAIAVRRDLTENMIASLAQKKDVKTAVSLLNNKHVTIQNSALEIFAEMSKTAYELNIPLIHRSELPAELAQSIYAEVGEEVRVLLTSRFPDADFTKAVKEALDDIQNVVTKATAKNTIMPAPVTGRVQVLPSKMVEALRLGQLTYFKAMFAEYTGLKVCMVDTLLKQKGGRGLAIACRAKKMERPDFMTLFMLKSAIASSSKIVDHGELAQALSSFDKLDTDYANKMLGKAVNAQGDFTLA